VIRPRSQRHLLVQGATVVTQDAKRRILEADVLITEGTIAALGPGLVPPSPTRLLDARGMAVLPGLIQTRAPLGRALLRGLRIPAGDPTHDDETAYWSGLLGAVACLTSGVTTVAGFEVSRGMDGMRRALDASGIRAILGKSGTEGTDVFSRADADAPAWLDAVTRGNAEGLGKDSEIGSLEAGKAGDLVVLDLRDPRSFSHPEAPWPDRVVTTLNRGSIRWVVVDGEVLVDQGRLPHLDLDAATQSAQDAARKLMQRMAEKGH